MTDAEFRHVLRLLDSASALLDQRRPSNDELRSELRRLVVELELFRAQVSQAPAESRRN